MTNRIAPGGPEAPAPPEMIWARPERASRGPRPAHSRAEIAAAAIALADAGGLGEVSMRKVAAALGAGTMSLYSYVPKKEHLYDLMLDAAVGEQAVPDEPSGDPRADLALLARASLTAMRRHPWMPELVLSRPSMGPNTLRRTEYFLGALVGMPMGGGAKMEAFAQLSGFVCQYAQWEHTAGRGGRERWQAELVAYLGGVIATGAFPHLAEALADAQSTPVAPDTLFTRSLDRLITLLLTPPEPPEPPRAESGPESGA